MISLDTALAADPLVLDYVVLPVATARSNDMIAYVVLDADANLQSVRRRIADRLPSIADHCHWVAVLSIPTDADGAPDVAALRKLPVLDAQLLDACTQAARADPAVTDAATVVEDWDAEPGLLHLSDILPSPQQACPIQPGKDAHDIASSQPTTKQAPALITGAALLSLDPLAPTLPDLLRRAAQRFPGEERIIFIDRDGQEQRLSYPSLLRQAECVLNGFRQSGLQQGDHAILQLTDNQDILLTFWACLLGGIVPLIMTPPPSYTESSNDLDKLVYVYGHLQSPFIILRGTSAAAIRGLQDRCEDLLSHLLSLDSLQQHEPDTAHHRAKADDLALFNLTSGSTGIPKCIGLTHKNLIMRALGANQANDHRAEDVILNWLPFDHIGSISDWHIRCVALGCRLVYAPKENVLGQPLAWLDLIDRYRVTHS
jgi:hypothetical protein